MKWLQIGRFRVNPATIRWVELDADLSAGGGKGVIVEFIDMIVPGKIKSANKATSEYPDGTPEADSIREFFKPSK
jgi:hypothetical protein